MITEEQIKNLKPGDPIIIHGAFWSSTETDNVLVTCPMTHNSKIVQDNKCFHPSCCHLPSGTTKYDPKRLFKKGDKVRIVEWNGRDIARVGQIGYVVADEHNSKVELAIDGWKKDVYYPVCHLELITSVEELNPYSVLETDTINGFDIMRDGLCVMTFPYGSKEAGYYRDEIGAKEAAEAECKRLNDEHRKEQNL